jgi:hypothetical protein
MLLIIIIKSVDASSLNPGPSEPLSDDQVEHYHAAHGRKHYLSIVLAHLHYQGKAYKGSSGSDIEAGRYGTVQEFTLSPQQLCTHLIIQWEKHAHGYSD